MPVRFGVVYLDSGDAAEQAIKWTGVVGIIAWDREADTIGAPQNVQSLHQLMELDIPVWYGGGLETVHTAELILGLGCDKVIVDKGFYKTKRSPEHFVRRLGEGCVPVIRNTEALEVAVEAGAAFGYCLDEVVAEAAGGRLKVVLAVEQGAGGTPALHGAALHGVALLP